uniref:DUF1622 domain-containing protein n=1 Tax=Marseillevirus LCMAC101 TaxID=2506602 RepID=A0A481YRC6_9VIRU|nr:MAG: protein of unknown function DUF1622 [Marseillevirus LCMAC101]
MDKIHEIASSDLGPIEDNDAVNFIKYKLEPFFEYALYILGMLAIILGAIDAIVVGWRSRKEKSQDETLAYMRIRLSETITLGLTFILAAEVIKTFRVPNIYQLLKVALLVLLRQLITHFLDKDVARLKQEYPNLITSKSKAPKEGYVPEEYIPEEEYVSSETYVPLPSASVPVMAQETCVACQ